MSRPYKILHCGIEELPGMLGSDAVVGWRVLAILPSNYTQSPMPPLYQQQAPPPGWELGPHEIYLEQLPTTYLTRVTIILES